MKPVKKVSLRDYKTKIIEAKKEYVIKGIEFRQSVLEGKEMDRVRRRKEKKIALK